jgi:5-methylcytosine-specific restriction endonuclease McrA
MRKEFPKSVKAQAFLRANGVCEGENCGARLTLGKFHYDHDLPDDLGGEPTLENCRVLCVVCHKEKTAKVDMPRIAKGRRIRERERGIKKPRTITSWRKFDGTPVHASRQR